MQSKLLIYDNKLWILGGKTNNKKVSITNKIDGYESVESIKSGDIIWSDRTYKFNTAPENILDGSWM